MGEELPPFLAEWDADGVIARIESQSLAQAIDDLEIAAVDLRGLFRLQNGASFGTDQAACAHLAADYFIQRGLQHFAYCGYPGLDYSDDRLRGFTEKLKQLGHTVSVFQPSNRTQPSQSDATTEVIGGLRETEIADWLRALPKPVGIFACNDMRGHQVLEACWIAEIAVPEKVAVLGVDNDEMLCSLSVTPLSSIEPDTKRLGLEGAALLDRMMEGDYPPEGKILVPPIRLEVRLSTDVMAVEDIEISAAISFIRNHACEGITVADITTHLAMSRTSLDHRFHKALGRSTKSEINRVRFDRAKQLLDETDFNLEHIAHLIGYATAAQFATGFKRHTGLTTRQYRSRKSDGKHEM